MAKKEASPTQQLVEIEEIKNGVAVLRGGGLRQILMVAGINFDLKSEEEQGLITFQYQNFLNGLDFPVQIFVHSRRLNIEGYLARLEERGRQETNELLKNQISEYKEFIKSFVADNPIMEKTFFVVVPYDPIQLTAAGAGVAKKLFGFLAKKPAATEAQTEQAKAELSKHMEQLQRRVDQVISGLNQIGLNAAVLEDEQVIELFYNLYNPEAVEKKTLEIARET